jgi:hypothetical protein
MSKTLYYVYHWFGGSLDEYGTFKHVFYGGEQGPVSTDAIELRPDELLEFAEKFGPIQLRPPDLKWPYWSIYVTDKTGKFNHK